MNCYWLISCAWLLFISGMAKAEEPIDASTLRHKVLCGYQGWFRCPDDPAKSGWRHWSRDSRKISPETLTFEMWPDMTELDDDEKYPAIGFTAPDGNPAQLFSSVNLKTVDRHFRWMQQYGIDGVFLQRFLAEGTAIFKVSNTPPKPGRFVTYDGLPSDRYLRLTGEGTKLIRGNRENQKTIPIKP